MQNLFNTIKSQIDHIGFLFNYCPGNSMASAICHDFWLYSVLTPVCLAALFLLWILFKGYQRERALKQLEKRRLAREQIADAEVLDQLKWRGMDSDLDDLSQEDLAEKLRQTLKSST